MPEQFLALAGTETAVLLHELFNISKHVILIHLLKCKFCPLRVNNFATSVQCKRVSDVAENL